MKKYLLISLALFYICSSQVFSWGSHYLVTDKAMSNLHMSFLSKKIAVKPFNQFIVTNQKKLALTFSAYYSWMQQAGKTKRINPAYFSNQFIIKNQRDFFIAARLNPQYSTSLVNRLMPDETRYFKAVDLKLISKYLHAKEIRRVQFENVAGKKVSALSVLRTFTDEPDWGFDHELFVYKDYGYGKQPYGKEHGESSKAPFHMQFLNENFIVRLFASQMTEGMVEERIELFQRLSKFAFSQQEEYWGYRFAAWAMHYIQDLAQPYHTKAIPDAGLWYYIKFIFSFNKDKIKKETTQLVANKHFLYEDFVAYGLEQSYLNDKPLYNKLGFYLAGSSKPNEYLYVDITTNFGLMQTTSNLSLSNGTQLDKSIIMAFGAHMTQDSSYDQETDEKYSIQKTIGKMKPEASNVLLKSTQVDFFNTGKSSRTMLLRCLNKEIKIN